MWYDGRMDDDEDIGMRADNPILVSAESVAVVSRMPLAADVREAAEIMATASGEKADVKTSVDNDEETDEESTEEQDPAINEAQQDALDDTGQQEAAAEADDDMVSYEDFMGNKDYMVNTAQQEADVEAAGAEPDKQQEAAGGGEEVALTAVRLRLRPPLLRRCGKERARPRRLRREGGLPARLRRDRRARHQHGRGTPAARAAASAGHPLRARLGFRAHSGAWGVPPGNTYL